MYHHPYRVSQKRVRTVGKPRERNFRGTPRKAEKTLFKRVTYLAWHTIVPDGGVNLLFNEKIVARDVLYDVMHNIMLSLSWYK